MRSDTGEVVVFVSGPRDVFNDPVPVRRREGVHLVADGDLEDAAVFEGVAVDLEFLEDPGAVRIGGHCRHECAHVKSFS